MFGIVASSNSWVPAAPAQARPVYVAAAQTVDASAAFTAALPAGWSEGQLAILHVASGSAAPSTPSGWTVVGSTLTSDAGTSAVYWRILQAGDTGAAISAGTNRVAIIWTFQSGTFNPSSPVVQIVANQYGATTTSAPGVPNSNSIATGEHYLLQFCNTYNAFNTVSAYPYASAQQARGLGTAPTFVGNRGCGANFDGGISASSSFTLSAAVYANSRKVAIIGLGYSA